jgi:hypothetical protein
MKPEVRWALLFALWHHQGGSSPIGQALRVLLGMGQFERIEGKALAAAHYVHGHLSAPCHAVATVVRVPFCGGNTSWAIDHPGLPIGTKLYLGPPANGAETAPAKTPPHRSEDGRQD